MARKLFVPSHISYTAFDTAGIELLSKGDRLQCRCQSCGSSWELPAPRLNKPAAVTDWQCLNGCNSRAERRSNQFPTPGTFARVTKGRSSYQTSW